MKFFIPLVCALALVSFSAAAKGEKHHDNEQSFSAFIESVKAEAKAGGISDATINDAFDGIEREERVIELDHKQPEVHLTLEEYLDKTVSDARINKGRNKYAENKALLDGVSQKYDVPAPVIMALWGIETSYGSNTGGFDIIEALATLAYDGRRSEYFRAELINALWILETDHIERDEFQGSWAGAMGQCQFMPTSFLKYAVDYDGDGKRDIWGSQPDVFASIANYLHSEGWERDGEIKEGSNNFKVLLKWNRSRYFATAVGELANAIGESQ